MHLPREADARDVLRPQAGLRQGAAPGDTTCPPPIFGVLLRPADLRRSERLMFFSGRTHHVPLAVNDQRTRPTRAYVYSKYVNICLRLLFEEEKDCFPGSGSGSNR